MIVEGHSNLLLLYDAMIEHMIMLGKLQKEHPEKSSFAKRREGALKLALEIEGELGTDWAAVYSRLL